MAKLNRQGILLKRADTLEKLNQIDTLVLDKTGTLTQGKFILNKLINLSGQADSEIMRLSASLEAYSEHPIARAFVSQAPLSVLDNVTVSPGMGISGSIGADIYRIGSAKFMQQSVGEELRSSRVFLQKNAVLLAAFELDDEIKPDALELISQFKHMQLLLLSGDNPKNVFHVAELLGIEHWHAQHTPQQKLAKIQDLQQQGHKVLMLGDGINDSPVLAQADVSVAVGNATDLAKNAADIILLGHRLTDLHTLFVIARQTSRKISQNIAWALGYNLAVLPLAVMGILSPWMAATGMSLSSIIVVYNSVRLLK
jgi:Cu2+-exporting ATPase